MTERILLALDVVWAFGLLFILYGFSQNGRYQDTGGNTVLLLDTRTGVYCEYNWKTKEWEATRKLP